MENFIISILVSYPNQEPVRGLTELIINGEKIRVKEINSGCYVPKSDFFNLKN